MILLIISANYNSRLVFPFFFVLGPSEENFLCHFRIKCKGIKPHWGGEYLKEEEERPKKTAICNLSELSGVQSIRGQRTSLRFSSFLSGSSYFKLLLSDPHCTDKILVVAGELFILRQSHSLLAFFKRFSLILCILLKY